MKQKKWRAKRLLSLWLCLSLLVGCMGVTIPGLEVQAAEKVRVIGYLPTYRTYAIDSIDYSALTHLNLSFMTYKNGVLSCGISDADMTKLKEKCKANNVKMLIALGGGGGFDVSGGNPFETASKRTEIINGLMEYVERWELDGIDIDIEVDAGNALWNNFDSFIAELSARLKAENKLLTIAVASWFAGNIQNSTYNYFDFINLMTYDENAGNGPVASQTFVESTVSYFRNRGIVDERMTIGVPFYGYGPGGWGDAYTYAQILEMNPEAAHMDYYNNIYYNGADTIRSKAEYAKDFGGIMIWELAQDASGEDSLLKVIKDTLGDRIGDPADSENSEGSGSTDEPIEETPSYEKYVLKDGNYYLSCSQDGKTYKIVSTTEDTTSPLTANADVFVADRDTLEVINNEDGTVSFRSVATGKYVCADTNVGGQLVPRSDGIDTWEKFNVLKINDTQCALLALSNNKYVAADFSNGGILTAMSDSVAGAWEAFLLTEAPEDEENTDEEEGTTGGNVGEEGEGTNGGNTGEEEEGTTGGDTGEEKDDITEETGTYQDWSASATYKVGDLVAYNNKVYECLTGHISNSAWIPGTEGLETLWRERTDLVNKPSEEGSEQTPETGEEGSTGEENPGTEQTPGTGEEGSTGEEKPGTEQTPETGEEGSAGEEKPGTGEEGSTGEEIPGTEQTPGTGEEGSTGEEIPGTEQTPETGEEGSAGEETPGTEQTPETGEEGSTGEEIPGTEQTPGTGEEGSAGEETPGTEQTPGTGEEGSTGEGNPGTEQTPGTGEEGSTGEEKPGTEQTPGTGEEGSTGEEKPGIEQTPGTGEEGSTGEEKPGTEQTPDKGNEGSSEQTPENGKTENNNGATGETNKPIQQPEVQKTVKVSEIQLSGMSDKIAVGKKIQLKAAVFPENATNKELKWESSNEKFAKVNADGVVYVKKAGANKKVTITVSTTDGSGIKESYEIKIMPKAIKKITLKAEKSVKAGKSIRIKVSISPSKKVNKTVSFSCNSKYATVNAKGVVKTKKAGKGKIVKITVNAMDGSGKKKTIRIRLK